MLIIWLDKKLRAASCASCFSSLDGIFSLSGLEVSSGRCSRMLLVELEGQKYYVKLSNRGGNGAALAGALAAGERVSQSAALRFLGHALPPRAGFCTAKAFWDF